jgi:hypothetical protein
MRAGVIYCQNSIWKIDKTLALWYRRGMQISPTNPLKPLSGDEVGFNILAISHKNSGKRRCNRGGFAAFWFTEQSVAQDFRGN